MRPKGTTIPREGRTRFACGDLDIGMGSSWRHGVRTEAFAVSAVYETARQLPPPMDPTATTAVWNDDRLTLYDST